MYKSFIHPILFGFFIPFSIYAHNSGEIRIHELILPFLIIVVINLTCLTMVKLLRGNVYAAAIILALFWVFFFQFNNLYTLGQKYGIRTRYWGSFLLIVLSLITFILFWLKKKTILTLTNMFFITSVLMFIHPSVLFVKGIFNELTVFSKSLKILTTAYPEATIDLAEGYAGDIYYIVLDGYGGNEVLTKYIHLDNTAFYKMLNDRGFVISYNSRSNYTSTIFSIASTFNMTYLDSLVQVYGEDFSSVFPLREYIYNSNLFKALKRHKYNLIMITSSSHLNPKRDKGLIDEFITYINKDQYLISVYSNTLLRFVFSANRFFFELDADSKPWVPQSIDWVFNKALTFVNNQRKDFVFMHILSPHEPYYFDKNGEIVIDNKSKKWNNYKGPFDNYREAYGRNLLGLNKKIEVFLDSLQSITKDMPIVIFQGDHGPPEIEDVVLDREGIDKTLFRTSILNAFLLPEYMRDNIHDGMTPVNTFRVILKHITGYEIELLANKSYKSDYQQPFRFNLLNQDR